MLSLLRALPPVSTVNGSKAIQSVLKEHREEKHNIWLYCPSGVG